MNNKFKLILATIGFMANMLIIILSCVAYAYELFGNEALIVGGVAMINEFICMAVLSDEDDKNLELDGMILEYQTKFDL